MSVTASDARGFFEHTAATALQPNCWAGLMRVWLNRRCQALQSCKVPSQQPEREL